MPAARHAAVTVGNRRCKARDTARVEVHTRSPVAAIRASMRAATTSRGARSPIGCTPAVTEFLAHPRESRPRHGRPR